ncbi:MAG: DUF2202 domain-containing protein, partial [Ilumatobacteraceae bacterium]
STSPTCQQDGAARGRGNGDGTCTMSTVSTATVGELSEDEIAGLLWMREEEQLAHDVYVALGEQWDVPVFTNIAASESKHVDSVKQLLDLYGIADPAAGNPAGTFTDPTLQAMYDTLVADGSESLVAALTVGATIEELDIRDLRDRVTVTDESAILAVYANLERASNNHLAAFVRELSALGVEFEPAYLDADDVDAIVADTDRGAANGPGTGNGQGAGNGGQRSNGSGNRPGNQAHTPGTGRR